MSLLKRRNAGKLFSRNLFFTFHYVAIKTNVFRDLSVTYIYFTFHYVAIKTLSHYLTSMRKKYFTFHYVAIKTQVGVPLIYE